MQAQRRMQSQQQECKRRRTSCKETACEIHEQQKGLVRSSPTVNRSDAAAAEVQQWKRGLWQLSGREAAASAARCSKGRRAASRDSSSRAQQPLQHHALHACQLDVSVIEREKLPPWPLRSSTTARCAMS